MTIKPWTDPIVAEVRQWREEVMREADYDVGKLIVNLKKVREQHPNIKFVNRQVISSEELQARIQAIYPEIYEDEEEN